MENLTQDLKEFIELLNSQKVEYVIVGGHAVAYYSYPRYTDDIDFFVRTTPQNAKRIISALSKFGFQLVEMSAKMFTQPDKVFS